MINPLEFKHDITSIPLRWMIEKHREHVDGPPSDADVLVFAAATILTAGANLFPALGLIQAGVRGESLFSHVTYARFNPWAKPIFHYTQAASKAERIGGAAGKFVYSTMWPNFSPTRKVWAKAGVKAGAKVGGRLIPGVGWALLAYDVYDIAFNQSLWGFDLS